MRPPFGDQPSRPRFDASDYTQQFSTAEVGRRGKDHGGADDGHGLFAGGPPSGGSDRIAAERNQGEQVEFLADGRHRGTGDQTDFLYQQ